MFMKKIFSFLILILLICGCEKEEPKIEITFDDNYYQVATPYKESVGNYSINSYDKEEVEIMLMDISNDYFKINNSLYQEGQYLTSEEIKELVNQYNKTETIEVDNIKIKPQYITSIYEQNYLATNNSLKGISLAIVVDNKQYYSDNSYKIIDEKIVLDYAKKQTLELIKYMRNKEELQHINIVVGIYLQNNNLKGSFKYVGYSENEKIKFDFVNYNYQKLDSNYVMNNDINTYNNVLNLKKSLNQYNNIYTSYTGLYKDNILLNIDIIVNSDYFNKGQILNISNTITKDLNSFPQNVNIKIYIKTSNEVKAFLNKEDNVNKINTYILEE